MRINHNIAALNAYRNLEINNENTSKSLEKLSSGLRINSAADDAAGLAISEKMRSQIRGLDMANRNALDGISVVQTADGALNSTTEILQRMRELAVQAANGSNTDSDRENIQSEINQLTSEVNRIGNTTEFNTAKLLNGSRLNTFVATGKAFSDASSSTTDSSTGLTLAIQSGNNLTAGTHTLKVTKSAVAGSTPSANDYQITIDNQPPVTIASNILDGTDPSISAFTGISGFQMDSSALKVGTFSFGIKDTGTGADDSIHMQIGANAGQTVTLEIGDMRAKALQISTDASTGGQQTITLLDGTTQNAWFTTTAGANDGTSTSTPENALDVTTSDKAEAAITVYDDAIQRVSSERARLGAIQNRLEYTSDNLQTMSQNVTSSESRIRDVDMALEMSNYTKNNILNQAAQAMLAQANQMPQGVLQLLK
jgi:flagellin